MFDKLREELKSNIENTLYNKIINSILEESISNYLENIKLLNKSDIKQYSRIQLNETLNLLEDYNACNYNINNLETFKNSFDLSIYNFTPIDIDNKMQLDLITTADTIISNGLEKHFNVLNNITESETFSGIEEKEVRENLNKELDNFNSELYNSLKLIYNMFNNRILKLLKTNNNPIYKELLSRSISVYKQNYKQLEDIFKYTKNLSFEKIKEKESLIEFIQKFKALHGSIKSLVLLLYSLKIYLSGLENDTTIGDLYNDTKYNKQDIDLNNSSTLLAYSQKYFNNTNLIRSESDNQDSYLMNFLSLFNNNSMNMSKFFSYFYDIASPEVKNAFNWIKNENSNQNQFNMILKQSKMSITYFHNFDCVLNSGINSINSLNKLLTTILEQPFETKINNEKLKIMGNTFREFSDSISELENDIISFKVNEI